MSENREMIKGLRDTLCKDLGLDPAEDDAQLIIEVRRLKDRIKRLEALALAAERAIDWERIDTILLLRRRIGEARL